MELIHIVNDELTFSLLQEKKLNPSSFEWL
jgi:hypothetical protein